MQVFEKHIRDLIEKGVVTPLPKEVSFEIEQRLEMGFPFKGSGGLIDWSHFQNSIMCEWMAVDDTEAVRWARSTALGKHEKVIVFYNSDEPCLIGDLDAVIRNLDSLVWTAPGPRIVIGADLVAGAPRISNDVIEFNGVDKLFGCPGPVSWSSES